MSKVTEKEEMVLREILSGSNFNGDVVDITKSWEEQRFEDPHAFWAFADVKDYGCGMGKQAVRGVFGSLMKKGLIDMMDDEDVEWIIINKKCFDKIRESL